MPRSKILTPRELEVAQLLPLGLTNGEIAARLRISEPTAKFHVCNVLGKLEVRNRTQAAAKLGGLKQAEPVQAAPLVELGNQSELGWPWLG